MTGMAAGVVIATYKFQSIGTKQTCYQHREFWLSCVCGDRSTTRLASSQKGNERLCDVLAGSEELDEASEVGRHVRARDGNLPRFNSPTRRVSLTPSKLVLSSDAECTHPPWQMT